MKIYTRTGDAGKTRLIGGREIAKFDIRLESYGSVDELNSAIGVFLAQAKAPHFLTAHQALTQSWPEWEQAFLLVQNELFNVGSLLACADEAFRAQLPPVPADAILRLEQQIDLMTGQLTPLRQFILPGGHSLAAALHLARTICRRAERHTVLLLQTQVEVEPAVIYLNRLSDHLFTAARWVNQTLKIADVTWTK